MGRIGFTEFFYFLSTGKPPTEAQQFFLEMSLVGLAEHGLTPSVQAARMTYAADPAAMQGAVAAGILGCGTVILGAARLCGDLLDEVLPDGEPASPLDDAALAVAREYRAAKRPIPGFGHPLHKPVDPRAERMMALSEERGSAGRAVAAARALQLAVDEAWGKPLPMNISMSIAATLRRCRRAAVRHSRRADPRPHRRPARPSRRGEPRRRSASCSPRPPKRRSSIPRPSGRIER